MLFAKLLFAALLLAALGVAFLRGGLEERTAALGLFAASALSPFAQSSRFASPEVGILLIDSLLFGVLAVIAIRSTSFWPIWAAGFQLGGLAVHLAAARMPGMLPAAYATTLVIWSYPVIVTVLLGAWREGRQRHPA